MKKKRTPAVQAAARGRLPELPKALLDELVKGTMTPSEVQDLMLAFNKAVIERAMGAEMNLHLGYRPGEAKPPEQANERNDASGKTVLTERGPLRVELPRDRDGSFEPILIPKHERRFTGLDERIIAMYARGMSVREIQAFLAESYGTEVSPDFISSVTDEVMAETLAWQSRPLEAMYPVISFVALRVKIRSDGVVSNKAVYLALGIQADGQRDVLGLWIEQTEGAKFWLKVFNELKTRGCQDILIAVVDGLKGLAEAINTAYRRTTVQTCIVHLIRNSLDYAGWKDRKAVAAALRPIYAAPSEQAAQQALQDFAAGPGAPSIRLAFTVLSGGLFTGERAAPISRYPHIPAANDCIARLTGAVFGDTYRQLVREGNTVMDSMGAAEGLAVLRAQAPERAVHWAHELQAAFYGRGLSLSDHDTIADIAAANGLDVATVLRDLQDGSAKVQATSDFALARQLGASSYPTLLFINGNDVHPLPATGTALHVLNQKLDALLT